MRASLHRWIPSYGETKTWTQNCREEQAGLQLFPPDGRWLQCPHAKHACHRVEVSRTKRERQMESTRAAETSVPGDSHGLGPGITVLRQHLEEDPMSSK